MSQAWHAISIDETLAGLRSRAEGLTDEEAARRFAEVGPNRLPVAARVSALAVLLTQLRSVIVYLLAAAIAVSLAFGDRLEAGAIAAVLVLNTVIGFVTEFRARRAMEALVLLDVPRASVVRNGQLRGIAADQLVPGDVVEIDAGRHVPGDARLINASDLNVDEAPLTGESMPVSKGHAEVLPADTPLADRQNMIFMGTVVTSGLARAVVTGTGAATEIGRIGTLVGSVAIERTPLERKLDVLGRRLVWLTLGVAGVIGLLGWLNGLPLDDVVETAIALAVAAVPEALPAVATITLAVGMHRMARRHALVRRPPAVESLGSTTVVCTDKTRTLTSGEMAVVRVRAAGVEAAVSQDGTQAEPPDPAIRRLLEAAALASRSQPDSDKIGEQTRVDPVDRAMLDAAARLSIDREALAEKWPEVELLPFSSDRKLMASFHRVDSRVTAFVKGAPVAVVAACSRVAADTGEIALDQRQHDEALDVNRQLAGQGLRVLAVASGEVRETSAEALSNLTLLGFVGLVDPPAPGVKETIEALRRAGLRTVMLTGDQRLTGEAIGRELGVIQEGDSAIDGRELDQLDAAQVADAVTRHAVFSRITPEHKLVIVRAMQAGGEIVAMLGDGVNDAAALKQADVGVSMGVRGTDVAKQAAAIVLLDDRFETVAAAVEEGRVIFDNIRKFVFYLFSCNVAEILVLLVAGLAGLPLPLLPLQLLWLNLVTDTFPALALALEPADRDVMSRPPRSPGEAILSRAFVGNVLLHAGLITAATLAAFWWALSARPDDAPTMAFMTLAFAQIAHLGNARKGAAVLSPRRMFSNPFALAGAGVAVALQCLAFLAPPLAHLLRLSALDAREWGIVVGLALAPALGVQVVRLVRGEGPRAPSAIEADR
jgi:Ca2+-transporting ATPase